jgi:hypothetical protein
MFGLRCPGLLVADVRRGDPAAGRDADIRPIPCAHGEIVQVDADAESVTRSAEDCQVGQEPLWRSAAARRGDRGDA